MATGQDELLTTGEAAAFLKVSRSFLEHDRCGESRISFQRVGRRVRYRASVLQEFLAQNSFKSTSEYSRHSTETRKGQAIPARQGSKKC